MISKTFLSACPIIVTDRTMNARDNPAQAVKGAANLLKPSYSPLPPDRRLFPNPMGGRSHEPAGPV